MKKLRQLLRDESPFIFALPALLWQIYFFYLPLTGFFIYSFLLWNGFARFPSFTFLRYQELFNFTYLKIIANSFVLASATSFICLLIGFPIAYFLAVKAGRFKTPLLIFLILPSWTSFIVQVYAWFSLLEKRGALSQILFQLGFTSKLINFLNTSFSTLIGMVYCYMPFMIFPLYAVLERLDYSFIEASADLGANRYETFKRVVLPLSKFGIIAGILLVFVPAFGEFVIPELLGGSKKIFIGTTIVNKIIDYNDWQSASALVFLAFIFPLILFATSGSIIKTIKKLLNRKKRLESVRTEKKEF